MNSLRPFLGLAVLFHSTLPFTSWSLNLRLLNSEVGLRKGPASLRAFEGEPMESAKPEPREA